MADVDTKPIAGFEITFAPAQRAVDLLVAIANDADVSTVHREAASLALATWRGALAEPWQIAMVDTNDELEVDDAGACVSEGDGGFFIQTWTWVEAVDDPDGED